MLRVRNVCSLRAYSRLKVLTTQFEDKYDSARVENGWHEEWSEKLQHSSKEEKTNRKTFRMVLPPPNITGDLHLGHALTVAVQDAICRFRRLQGEQVLWIPGMDHAGIATQAVLERKIAKERPGEVLSREDRLKVADQWKIEKETIIKRQLCRLGSSLDWSQSLYTMDSKMNSAVTEAFVRLYNNGKIYRDHRLVNWCSTLRSTLSDIEVDHIEVKPDQKVEGVNMGCLHQIVFPIVGGGEIVVSTGRLETTLADVAVAVNPSDERYAHLEHMKTVVEHPITKRKLVLIKDDEVDAKAGTGAMKVTPAYSKVDFDLCARHGISDIVECFDDSGRLIVPGFEGDARDKATNKIKKLFDEFGLYRGKVPTARMLPICSRTGTIVEQRLKPQWYLRCQDGATRVLEEVDSGRVELLPKFYSKVLREWLTRSQDWCISRQLWWGHQIPAYILPNGQWVVATDPSQVPQEAKRDPDVLDTWFSSGIFPLVALGWPQVDRPPALDLMETGHDILFFWVFRMILLSLELCDQVPFEKVMLHGLLRDAQGRKMSKSLGNAIDPNHIIDGAPLEELQRVASKLHSSGYMSDKELKAAHTLTKKMFPHGLTRCGADALRFSLLKCDVGIQDVKFITAQTVAARNLCNKIWQGVRFYANAAESNTDSIDASEFDQLDKVDLWILNKLHSFEQNVKSSLDNIFTLHNATHQIEKFWMTMFCDIYLEYVKPDIWKSTPTAARRLAVMSEVISSFLIIVSPFFPHLTEELHHKLQLRRGTPREQCGSVHEENWPNTDQWSNDDFDLWMNNIIEKASEVRIIKQKQGLDAAINFVERLTDADERDVLTNLCKLQQFNVATSIQ